MSIDANNGKCYYYLMGKRALYREYRPKRFSEVIGQDHITTILKNQIVSGRVSHAYLFCGTRGTGKTSTAKIFAKALNCLSHEDGEPCMNCAACADNASGVDIIELDAASNTGVDDMRSLLDKVRFTPLKLKYKVYIIDEAHMLSGSAFNALLKTLEEPPAHIVFILATTEPQRLPATIISRCQRFDFRRLNIDDMIKRMKEVLMSAGGNIDDEGLLAIARAADGGMRDALSLVDQCMSFCGENVSANDVYSVLGGMDNDFLFSIADALIDSRPDDALKLLEQVVNEGRDLTVFSHDMALHMRALLITKLCGHCSDILDCTEDSMRRYQKQAERASAARLERAVSLLLNAQSNLRWLTLPRVLLESTLVKITRPEDETTLEALTDRLDRLEKTPTTVCIKEVVPEAKKNEPLAADIIQKETFEPHANDIPENDRKEQTDDSRGAENVDDIWTGLLDELQKTEITLYVMAKSCKRVAIDETKLKVGFDKPAFVKAMDMPDKKRIINDLLHKKVDHLMFVPYIINDNASDSIEQKARALFGDKLEIEE